MKAPERTPAWQVPFSQWWHGEYIPPPQSDHVVFLLGTFRRHWSSRTAHWIAAFWVQEWKWIIPVVISIIGLIVAIARLTG